MWTVTRQSQWPDGGQVVEISSGGIDYTNPGALAAKYPGEMEEYADPREAVEAAIKIAEAWKADAPDKDILIDHGATGGMTMPFDGMELGEETSRELREWAEGRWEAVAKCDQCGEAIRGNPTTLIDYGDDWQFCGEHCAERWWEAQQEPEEDEEDEEDEAGGERGFYYASRYHAASRLAE